MNNRLVTFLEKSEEKAFSKEHRKRLKFNMGKYHTKVALGKQQFQDLEQARQTAKNIKAYTVANLAQLLQEFEEKFTARGGKVIWAENISQAQDAISQIMKEKAAKVVVKSKSMITEEIQLNRLLEEQNIEVLETDLGEFIVQVKGEAPYHIVTPAMHLSKEDIAELFHEKFDTPLTATPEELTAYVRKVLRARFAQADIGISGGNFLLADTGSMVLVENEGNARLTTTLPKTHIAIVGIEKMIPSIEQLDLFLPLLATYGTGQNMTVYNTILSGPKQTHEIDGPEDMYIILLDNGRSSIMQDEYMRESMYCIRCGSCLNNCPVYQTIGGHTYDSPYSGPIGAVISPHLGIGDFEDNTHLSHASSLCGSCTENCPVNINLHKMLLYNRSYEEAENLRPKSEQFMWKAWRTAMLSRSMMNAPSFSKNLVGNLFLSKAWGERRTFPKFPKYTFNQLWKKGKV
ncbi:LutB/LldF family L-lactate oxidation iron-sulfur protein [Aureispira anguillae]|uniref:LutB/LldF family L-lactate oxidation iron-sulfurprotein n=1 Tax=Aureispira anguillae TaxID=2864201 RepID=A0A915YIV2_9BACT|nr:LutB/LldF family L-lactate oxidation iron-sulfur protein [Aureispira anguillae]BDS14012.1 LutB/LldF family L-lactate oxidation iron-sulfurprotein [Aureispira anguillae]